MISVVYCIWEDLVSIENTPAGGADDLPSILPIFKNDPPRAGGGAWGGVEGWGC